MSGNTEMTNPKQSLIDYLKKYSEDVTALVGTEISGIVFTPTAAKAEIRKKVIEILVSMKVENVFTLTEAVTQARFCSGCLPQILRPQSWE